MMPDRIIDEGKYSARLEMEELISGSNVSLDRVVLFMSRSNSQTKS